MSTAPAAPGGLVTVQDRAVQDIAVPTPSGPKVTAAAPDRLVPVIVTVVPPAAGPEAGLTAVTVGVAVNV